METQETPIVNSKMTIDEQEEVLRHWETFGEMSDEIRNECIEAIIHSDWTKEQWMDYLYPVPHDLITRYRKALQLLLEKKLIDQTVVDQSLDWMKNASPVAIAKDGKAMMDWYREEQAIGFPSYRLSDAL